MKKIRNSFKKILKEIKKTKILLLFFALILSLFVSASIVREQYIKYFNQAAAMNSYFPGTFPTAKDEKYIAKITPNFWQIKEIKQKFGKKAVLSYIIFDQNTNDFDIVICFSDGTQRITNTWRLESFHTYGRDITEFYGEWCEKQEVK